MFCSWQPHPLLLLLQTFQICVALRHCLTVQSEVDLELMILLPWPLTTGTAVWFIIPSLGSWLFLTIPAPGMRACDRGQSLVFYTYGWVQSTGHSACQSRHRANIWWVNKMIFKLSFNNNNKCTHLLFQFNHSNTILLVKMQCVGKRQEGTKTRKRKGEREGKRGNERERKDRVLVLLLSANSLEIRLKVVNSRVRLGAKGCRVGNQDTRPVCLLTCCSSCWFLGLSQGSDAEASLTHLPPRSW